MQVDHKDTLSIIKDRRIDRTCILNESQISTEDVGTEYNQDHLLLRSVFLEHDLTRLNGLTIKTFPLPLFVA